MDALSGENNLALSARYEGESKEEKSVEVEDGSVTNQVASANAILRDSIMACK